MVLRKFNLAILTIAVIMLAACSTQPSGSVSSMTGAAAQPTTASTQLSSPVSNCTAPASLTPAATEGPYYKAGSPERASLLDAGITGTRLVLTGFVFTPDCRPVAHVLLDFWQADSRGNYDNSGYTLRGHQFTDAAGRYQLTTVVPGLYPGRTQHIHVKTQAPNGSLLTTQLFFPGVPDNSIDSFYDARLLLTVKNMSDGVAATFTFVINAQ